MSLAGKIALVTGAATGIGAAVAHAMAGAGATVVATDIDAKGGADLVTQIQAAGGNAIFHQHDVRREEQWQEVASRIGKEFRRLDITVANAGIAIAGPIETMPLADWQRQQSINLDGVFLAVKHSVALMRAAGGGSIILMSSVAGLRGAPGLAGYAATKGGVRLFAKAAALELAADKIRVNSVHPGVIDTAIWSKMTSAEDGVHRAPRIDPHERVAHIVPAGIIGTPRDVADGVLFLASDASRYMTGSELVIDGGMTAGPVPRRPG